MKIKSIYIFTILSFAFLIPTSAQEKILDKSGKKPDWITSTQRGYIIGAGTLSSSLETAKDAAITDVRKQITEAIAVQVKSVSESIITQLMNNEETSLTSSFNEATSSQTANRDYITGVAASKIEAYYWEYVRNKSNKNEYYNYYVKYPFSESELDKLVRLFKKKDQELTDLLESLLAVTENYTSVEEIEQCKAQLEKLVPLFIDERKNKAEVGIETCRSLLNSVYIANNGSTSEQIRYTLQIGNKIVKCAKKPQVRANCAEIKNKSYGNEINTINFSAENCYDEPGNYISVHYRIGTKYVDKKFSLDATDGETELKLLGTIRLSPEKGEIVLKITSKYNTPTDITSIELSNETLGLHLYKSITETISGEGTHNITLSVDPFEIQGEYTSAELNGFIEYKAKDKGEQKSLRIYRQKAVFLK